MKHINNFTLFESSSWGGHDLTSTCPNCEGTGRIPTKQIQKTVKKVLQDAKASGKFDELMAALVGADEGFINGFKEFIFDSGIFSPSLLGLVETLKLTKPEIQAIIKKTESTIAEIENLMNSREDKKELVWMEKVLSGGKASLKELSKML
jgi:hypothetical protein